MYVFQVNDFNFQLVRRQMLVMQPKKERTAKKSVSAVVWLRPQTTGLAQNTRLKKKTSIRNYTRN